MRVSFGRSKFDWIWDKDCAFVVEIVKIAKENTNKNSVKTNCLLLITARSWFRAFTLDPSLFQLNPNPFQMDPTAFQMDPNPFHWTPGPWRRG